MIIKVWLQETQGCAPQEIEGYICEHSYDEEQEKTFFYSSLDGQEVLLNQEEISQITQTDFSQIVQNIKNYTLNKKSSDLQKYIDSLEHPLSRYSANFIANSLRKNEEAITDEELLLGAKILLTSNPQYHKNKEVTQTINFIRQNQSIKNKPVQELSHYLKFLRSHDLLNLEHNKHLSEGLVVKAKNIPNSYYKNQAKIDFEQGKGKIEITEKYKQTLNKNLIQDQKASLQIWTEYLSQQNYPDWYCLYVLEGLKKMGAYDKDRNRFSKRRKDYVGVFPELNREALAQIYDYIVIFHNSSQKSNPQNEEEKILIDLLKTGSFVRLYEYFLVNTQGIVEWDKEVTDGEWITYEQTEDKDKGKQLALSLQGYNTGWCTAGVSTAQSQLSDGDFHVYYSKNKLGVASVPRIAIRMEGDQITEVRGIEGSQNLESKMSSITDEKISQFPGGEKYSIKTIHMEELTSIWEQVNSGKDLTDCELRFLYEIDEEIQGFGYDTDPRIPEILKIREKSHGITKDLCKALHINEEEILFPVDHEACLIAGDDGPSYIYRGRKYEGNINQIKFIHGDVIVDTYGDLPENIIIHRDLTWNSYKPLPQKFKARFLMLKGDIYHRRNPHQKHISVPENAEISNLTASEVNIDTLPQHLKIPGIVSLNNCNIKNLPETVEAEEFILTKSSFDKLPSKIKTSYLCLKDTTIKKIDSELISMQTLNIENSSIEILPDDLKVELLKAAHSKIQTFPKNIKARYIDIQGTNIQELPQNLSCGTLCINYTKIKKLPTGVAIKDMLYARGSELEELPDDLTIDSINISASKIKKLPKNLKTKSLLLHNCLVEEIPEDLQAKKLDIRGSNIKDLPENLQVDTLLVDYNYSGNIPKNIKQKHVMNLSN